MAQDFDTFLKGARCKFVARAHYFVDGDFVTYYQADERCYAKRVDDLVTVYLSMATNKLVGCKIKGVRRLLREGGNFGVLVKDEGLRLSFLFLIGLTLNVADDERRKMYTECANATKAVFVDKREIIPAVAA